MSSRSTGRSGLGTNSARMQFSCHYTSYLGFWYRYTSVSSLVTYSHRGPLGFYFISRLEDDQLKLPAPANRLFSFVRTFPSISAYFFLLCSIRNSLSGSRPVRGHIHPVPCGPVFSYLSSTASISHVIFIPLAGRPCSSACGPRRSPCWHSCRTNRRDLWPPLFTPLYPAQQLYMVCIPHPLSVFVP